jgi:lipopolysaccharide/colanic/teichoic acid biosynthesis glycosyltransferase
VKQIGSVLLFIAWTALRIRPDNRQAWIPGSSIIEEPFYIDHARNIHSRAMQSSNRLTDIYSNEPASQCSNDSAWSDSQAKRAFDILVAATALLLSSPFILFTALAVKLSSTGPALFRQIRVGKNGRNFLIWKFRTMRVDSICGPSVTQAGDCRLTSIGGALRRLKLDELPQLVNVLKGDMSLVGERPKVPHHQTHLLWHRPGITGAATLAFRREEELLCLLPGHALDEYQVKVLMPLKRKLDDNYMREATFASDLLLLFRTVLCKGALIADSDLRESQQSLLSLSLAVGASAARGGLSEPETGPAANTFGFQPQVRELK